MTSPCTKDDRVRLFRRCDIPVVGSWLNLVEVFFSVITRQAIRRGSFTSSRNSSPPSRLSATGGTACRQGRTSRRRCARPRSRRATGRASALWACRRPRHSAGSSSDISGFVVVTHPFHPLKGERLEVLYSKRRGADTVFVCSGGVSGQITLPLAWTDRGEPPAPRRLSAEGLAELDTLARNLRSR